MSYYYDYYIGYKDKETKKIYPLGPFDCFKHFHPILSRSSFFASDLHDDFYSLGKEYISPELKHALSIKEEDFELYHYIVKYLPLSELGSGDYIKKGYFLISDIERYEKQDENSDTDDLFNDYLTPTAFSILLQKGLYGKTSNYAWFCYPDYTSKEYETNVIKTAAESYEFAFDYKDKDRYELIVIETEG